MSDRPGLQEDKAGCVHERILSLVSGRIFSTKGKSGRPGGPYVSVRESSGKSGSLCWPIFGPGVMGPHVNDSICRIRNSNAFLG
jgi:hypothetical protein